MKYLGLISGLLGIFSGHLHAEKVCERCEEIREYNAKYHQDYEYYEDYLKENHASSDQSANEASKEQKKPVAQK